jgi:O-acetyl-ADP-ribose deacetylase (regulator of RNase III)
MPYMMGDITKIDKGIICHQVNCQGKMGAGVALQIRQAFPLAYQQYMASYQAGQLQLGNVVYCKMNDQLVVAHLCGQYYYGRDKQYTDYVALDKALRNVHIFSFSTRLVPYIPFKMGCSLAGGNWNIVNTMIEKLVPNAIIVQKT